MPVDLDSVKWFASLGVGGVLAGVIFYFYQLRTKEFTAQWQGQAQILMQVVKENSAAITANTATIQALHKLWRENGNKP